MANPDREHVRALEVEVRELREVLHSNEVVFAHLINDAVVDEDDVWKVDDALNMTRALLRRRSVT